MENEDSSLTKFVDFYRTGYQAYCRLVYAAYGGEPVPRAANPVPPAPDGLASTTTWNSPETAP